MNLQSITKPCYLTPPADAGASLPRPLGLATCALGSAVTRLLDLVTEIRRPISICHLIAAYLGGLGGLAAMP